MLGSIGAQTGIWPWINNVASVASIVSLAVSIYLVWAIRKITRYYRLTITMPDRLQALRAHSLRIERLVGQLPKSKGQIEQEMSRCVAILKNLEEKVQGSREAETIGALIRTLSAPLPNNVEKDDVRYTNRQVVEIHYSLLMLEEERRLER